MRCNTETSRLRDKQQRRRLAQNKRLFKEFPWLWAIKNVWNMARENVLVGTREVGGISLDTLLNEPSEDCFMWVVRRVPGSGNASFKIEKVEPWTDGMTVATTIYHRAVQNEFKEVIYIVHCADMGTTRIFRPEKKGGTFNAYLNAILYD